MKYNFYIKNSGFFIFFRVFNIILYNISFKSLFFIFKNKTGLLIKMIFVFIRREYFLASFN